MTNLYGAQLLILYAILNSQKDGAGYVLDRTVADDLHMSLDQVREWLRTLVDEQLIDIAETNDGLKVFLTHKGIVVVQYCLSDTHSPKDDPSRPPVVAKISDAPRCPPSIFRLRDKLPRLDVEAKNATEILFVGVSLISIMVTYKAFFVDFLKKRSRLRFLICNPDDSGLLGVWDSSQGIPAVKLEIDLFLDHIAEIAGIRNGRSTNCQVRLTSFLPPYSAVLVDPFEDDAWMILELHGYKKIGNQRPHVCLTRRTEMDWFIYFFDEAEVMWASAKDWSP